MALKCHIQQTVLAKRKEAENQQMVQNPAKGVTCPLSKSASHAVTVDGTLDAALLEVQAASFSSTAERCSGRRSVHFSVSGLKPKPSEVSWRLSMFCE